MQEEAKADSIHEIETKNKVLASLADAFKKQKSVMCDTKLTFNFEKGIKDVRASLFHFGAPRDHHLVRKQSQWPYFEALRNPQLELFEQEQQLSSLRVTKIEWTTVDVICTLMFHFNNGSRSP